jgi:hypothetical protein
MPNPINVLPDDEAALIRYLGTVPEVVALTPATSISSELPADPAYPVVLVHRIGGTATGYWNAIDEPVVQIDVEGEPGTKAAVKKLAQTVGAAVLAIANEIVDLGELGRVVLCSADEEVGLQWLPDPDPVAPYPRYIARYRLITHN